MIRTLKMVATAVTCCAIAVAGSDAMAGKGGKGGGGGSRGGGHSGGGHSGGSRSFSSGGGHHGGGSRGSSGGHSSGSMRSFSSGGGSGSFSGSGSSSKGSRHFGSSSGGNIQQHGHGSSSQFRRGGSASSDFKHGDRSHGSINGTKSKDGRSGSVGSNQFDRHGKDGRHTAGFRGGDGDGRRGGDWDRHGGNGNNWNKSGWNGRGRNRHNHWHRGFWGWGGFGYRPWWGFGYPLVGFGLGYGGWGYNPYYYGGWNSWGYGPWGYDAYYYNPYYVSPLVIGPTVVDYSQPLVMASPTTGDQFGLDDTSSPGVNDAQSALAMHALNQAREEFRNGDYSAALDSVHRAIGDTPNDPALHEFRALVLFAQGNYQEAAATVHAVLSGGPGWDWETMSGLYPSVDVYTTQLRALESYARANAESADARFLLGYHYMTEGYQDAGLRQFQRVLELQPEDALVKRIVQSAQPSDSSSEDIPLIVPGPTFGPSSDSELVETPPPELPGASGEQTIAAKPTAEQMTGSWSASSDQGTKFQLTLTADGTFSWQYAEGDQTKSLDGKYTMADDLLILEPKTGPPMIGRISESAENGFNFRILGTADEDPGLRFAK